MLNPESAHHFLFFSDIAIGMILYLYTDQMDSYSAQKKIYSSSLDEILTRK